jgi:hypothetical protein
MNTNYRKYCEYCYVALDDRHQLNGWYVGAFLGIGRDLEIALFGLFLLKTVDVDHIKGVFKSFLKDKDKKPQTFITYKNNYF